MMRLALALALVGCAMPPGPSDAGPADAGPLALALGTGAASFVPIADGDTLLLAHGCQGLQHVWISLRATGIAPRGVHVQLSLARRSDGVLVSAPFDTAITFTPDPSGAYADLSGLMLVVQTPSMAIGAPLVLTGTIADRAGHTTSSQRDVSLAWGTQVCGL